MRRFSVYLNEMSNVRFRDRDVETLFSGGDPQDADLARLVPLLESLRDRWAASPSELEIQAFAALAAAQARESRPAREDLALGAQQRWDLGAGVRHRLAGAAAAMLLLCGMTGVAAASNGSAPGDALYGIDRALEQIGVGAGGARERILEAQALLDRGEVSEAITHSVEAFEPADLFPETSSASEALIGAAEKVAGDGGQTGAPAAVREAVAAMLSDMAAWIDSGEIDGREFGRRIAELARLIGASQGGQGQGGGPPGPGGGNGRGGGPPAGTPGPPSGNPGQGGGQGRP